ncbi:energy transducer TonB [Spirosoma koreense]
MPAFLLLFLLLGILQLPAHAQADSTASANSPIFTVVEQPPQFPGGMRKLGDYIKQNLHYPEAARTARLEGRVFITFIVTDQGIIRDVKALNHLGQGLDEEAVRLVASMPAWEPGRQQGRAVNVRYNIPVNFSLR